MPEGVTLADDGRSFLASDAARWLVGLLDLDQAGRLPSVLSGGDQVLGELGDNAE